MAGPLPPTAPRAGVQTTIITSDPTSKIAQADNARGLLVGLAAGDRNGGPVQMALALAETLATRGQYDPSAGFRKYHEWWAGGKGPDAWDTGPTTNQQLRNMTAHGRAFTLAELESISQKLDAALQGKSAGANAVHRVPPLALAGVVPDGATLSQAARQESRLTHWSALSQHSCAVVCFICRELVRGVPWAEVIQNFLQTKVDELAPDTPAIPVAVRAGYDRARSKDGDDVSASMSRGGFCVDVLKAAVYFVTRATSFDEALAGALKFAGPDNYCPVLVGAFAGARFGAAAIGTQSLSHCRPGVVDRCFQTADLLNCQKTSAGGTTDVAA